MSESSPRDPSSPQSGRVAEPRREWGELNQWGLDVGDMTQIDDNLRLSPEERLRRADTFLAGLQGLLNGRRSSDV